MNFRLLFFALLLLLIYSCKTNQTINHQREGKWVYKDTVNGILLKSKGRYKKSIEIKTWRYFENRKLVKKEQYNDSICNITTFDQKSAERPLIGKLTPNCFGFDFGWIDLN